MSTVVRLLRSYGWILVIAILFFTGALRQLNTATQSVILKAGFMDASPDPIETKEEFDYGFVIKDLAGKKIDVSEYKGKVVFLNLWATWCGPCRSEMPSIQKLYDQVDHNKVEFIMLSLDKDGDLEKIKKYVKKNEFSFPVFQPSGYLTEQLNVPSIPTTFVINRDGTVAFKEVGMRNYNTEKFKKFLNQLTP